MWIKYTYVCTDCDALVEITSDASRAWEPSCICGGYGGTVLISEEDGNAPMVTHETNITFPQVVKINSNPYN